MHVQDQCKSQIKHMMNNGPICKFTWETHFHCQVLIFPSLPVLQFILQCTVSYTAHGVVKLISHGQYLKWRRVSFSISMVNQLSDGQESVEWSNWRVLWLFVHWKVLTTLNSACSLKSTHCFAHPHVGHSSGATGDDCVSRGSSIAMVVSTYPAMSKI